VSVTRLTDVPAYNVPGTKNASADPVTQTGQAPVSHVGVHSETGRAPVNHSAYVIGADSCATGITRRKFNH